MYENTYEIMVDKMLFVGRIEEENVDKRWSLKIVLGSWKRTYDLHDPFIHDPFIHDIMQPTWVWSMPIWDLK